MKVKNKIIIINYRLWSAFKLIKELHK